MVLIYKIEWYNFYKAQLRSATTTLVAIRRTVTIVASCSSCKETLEIWITFSTNQTFYENI